MWCTRALVVAVCVLVCASAWCAAAYPQVAEQFEAAMTFEIVRPYRPVVRGSGTWDVDQPAGKSHLVMDLEDPAAVDVDVVERFDLGHMYEVNNATKDCFEKSLIGAMPPVWAWLAEATNVGHRNFHGHQCDVWEWKIATLTLAACFHENLPLVFRKEISPNDYEVFMFQSFKQVIPDSSKFDIPALCTKMPSQRQPFKLPGATPPVISSTFESRILVEFRDGRGFARGDGAFVVDAPAGKGRQFYDLQESTRMVRVDTLERYDKKMLYVIDSVDGGCHKQQLNSTHMPSPWTWVKYATDNGHHDFHGFYCNLWTYSAGGIRLSLCTSVTDSSRPLVFVEERSRSSFSAFQFDEWSTETPQDRIFDVPSVCA
mgnify:FL=1